MRLSDCQLHRLLTCATDAAIEAGRLIATVDRQTLQVKDKVAGDTLSSQVVTQVDVDSQALIVSKLASSLDEYGIVILAEEGADEVSASRHSRHDADYFWSIDPLDGTLPFIEGTAGFAVSIALVRQDGSPVLGVVMNPATGDYYQALLGNTVTLLHKNGMHWQPIGEKGATSVFDLFIDRSFLNEQRFNDFLDKLESTVRDDGFSEVRVHHTSGAVMNAIKVMETPNAAYLKLPKKRKGGGSLWDFSATAAIAEAARQVWDNDVWVSDCHGAPLDLNRPDSHFMNHKGVVYLHHRGSDGAPSDLYERVIQLCRLIHA
ncbi:3'(2'),5'-bisphosphate nucleotidase CysQ family protein [Thaumasiovibrio subtropicus]|nr:inositol monophosphatase family protein [Thaumasiovibrio subtropicus]